MPGYLFSSGSGPRTLFFQDLSSKTLILGVCRGERRSNGGATAELNPREFTRVCALELYVEGLRGLILVNSRELALWSFNF